MLYLGHGLAQLPLTHSHGVLRQTIHRHPTEDHPLTTVASPSMVRHPTTLNTPSIHLRLPFGGKTDLPRLRRQVRHTKAVVTGTPEKTRRR